MKKKLTCIACPIGCEMTVEGESSDGLEITGNRCGRGEIYAREEVFAPRRIVTATVTLRQYDPPRLPVRTDVALGKELIPGLLRELYRMEIEPPVEIGDIIVSDYRGSGVNVVATRGTLSGNTA